MKKTPAPKPPTRAFLEGQVAALEDKIGTMRRAFEMNAATLELARAENEKLKAELADIQRKIADGKIWNKENPRWTPRTQAALGLAAKEALAQGASYVGTEHVLLGLLKQEEGIAHRHFLAAGMSYEKAEYAMRVGRVS